MASRALQRVMKTVRKIDAKFAKYEDEFGKQTWRGKIGIVFAVAAAASVLPGGYIALEIWMGRKAYGWLRQKLARRVANDHGPIIKKTRTRKKNH
jgi:hypothetical protein